MTVNRGQPSPEKSGTAHLSILSKIVRSDLRSGMNLAPPTSFTKLLPQCTSPFFLFSRVTSLFGSSASPVFLCIVRSTSVLVLVRLLAGRRSVSSYSQHQPSYHTTMPPPTLPRDTLQSRGGTVTPQSGIGISTPVQRSASIPPQITPYHAEIMSSRT